MKKLNLILLIVVSFCLGVFPVSAQESGQVEIDASSLSVGEPFRFTITVDSDENRSFSGAQTSLTAVLCPVNGQTGSCQTLSQSVEGTDSTSMRITFSAEALPFAGDYSLEVIFYDSSGEFASQTASYLLRGVKEAGVPTATPEPELGVRITVKPVKLTVSMLDTAGNVLNYGSTIYVGDPYTLQIRSDSYMNDSVNVVMDLPASWQTAPLDPESECLSFMNSEGTALTFPGSLWNDENGGVFRCELRYDDRVWLPGEMIRVNTFDTGIRAEETFEMIPLSWNAYPTTVTQHPATHQAQISDSRGNLLCSDTVACGMFNSDGVYILTYRFPAQWGAALPSGGNFTADVIWPAEWAGSISGTANMEAASAYGEACTVDEDGVTRLELSEGSAGRYSASCAFNPGAVAASALPSIRIHLNDNSWAVRDLNVSLSPVIVKTSVPAPETPTAVPTEVPTEIPTESPTGVPTEVPVEAPTEIPEPIGVTIGVTLEPTMRDEADNNLIYGSTLYVGENYYLQIRSDHSMNDSVMVNAALPASLLSAPLDPASECLGYLNAEGTGLSIPGSRWNAENNNTFRCELRFTDSAWLTASPYNFSISASGIPAEETYEMAPLSWNYYPVSIAKYAATQQVQIADSRGNLICSDNVPCSLFNADDVYTFTYKFPADWGAAMPSGKSFSAELTWPENWGMSLYMAGDLEFASQFGSACQVGPDGTTHLELSETAPGRYAASCTFSPSGISSPSQAPIRVHLNDNAYNVNDLNVYLPASIIKQQAVLSPSLTMRVLEGSPEEEQIHGSSIGTLYRSTVDYPNSGGGYDAPALYTLKARIEGISTLRSPQWGDHVRVKWSVLDTLAQTGDLPACLAPAGDGYELGTLERTDDGIWQAECSFRFPLSMPENTPGGTLQMELNSGMYGTSSSTGTVAQPFTKKTLALNLDIPVKMVLNQPMDMHVTASDETGGLSDYARAVLSRIGANVYSDWEYNYATSCMGSYELSENGEADCIAEFSAPTDSDSHMHFELTSPALAEMFNIEFRPGADVQVARVTKTDIMLLPSLTLQTVPGLEAGDQISGGWISSLYRTAAEMPNAAGDVSSPARYTLRADVSGVYPNSQPRPDDSVLVKWNVLDALAVSGDLPSCLEPAGEGYRLGSLMQSGEQTWTASCDLYFPRTMSDDLQGGAMEMMMDSGSYDGSVSVQMNGNAFRRDKLYIDISVPEKMVLNQPMEISARILDDSGSLSDYARAVIAQTGAGLYNDWIYNFASSCQGVYDLSYTGEDSCTVEFYTPTGSDSSMHFELTSPALAEMFNVEFRPGSDIHVASIDKTEVSMTPSLMLQMMPGMGESEQISGGWISSLYRTADDMPNVSSADAPVRYTLRADISGVYPNSQPQGDDFVQVNWSVLDALAMSGGLPSCLAPAGSGYRLGDLEQNGEQSWTASCDLYFPASMPDTLTGGSLEMEMVSSAYQGSAYAQMNGNVFRKDNLYIDVNVPNPIILNQPMEIRVRMSDDTGGISEYLSAVVSRTGAGLYSDWMYNNITSCQGYYDLSMTGEESCSFQFYAAADQESTMHFELTDPGLEKLFNVTYRPGSDILVPKISKLDVSVSPSLTLQMTPYSGEWEQIGGGWIGTLYRTASDMPNVFSSADLPARYTLRANISGVFEGSQPQGDELVLVNWPLIDALSLSGNLPSCLTPAGDGYALGMLEQNGERSWTASCDFYFPETLTDDLSGELTMQLVSPTYQGSGAAQMSGNAFKHENLYVDLDIPEHMLIRQMTEFHVRVSDDSGSLSEYSKALLNSAGSALYSDWVYNFVTTCQGLYEIDEYGNAVCSALFEAPTGGESFMHFELASPGLENLFNVVYRPSADIRVAEVTNPSAELTVKLFHAGTEMPLPASPEDSFHVGEAYQLQFHLTPAPEFRDVMNAVAVDGEGMVMDWYEPLRIHWGMLPGGETSLNFYRDGDHFIARYDFDFAQGGLNLEGILSQLVVECWIDNWNITGVNNMAPIQLPSFVDKHPVELQISGFLADAKGASSGSDVYVDREAYFDVSFSGSLDHFDAALMRVGYEANGITTEVSCFPDYGDGSLHCSFIPQCTDLNFDEYPAVCGTNLTLYAEYGGDPFNEAASAVRRTFNVRRGEVYFTPDTEGSLGKSDLMEVEQAESDLQNFGYGSVRAGTWNVDSFLAREVRSINGSEYKSYPVIFRYQINGGGMLDDSQLRLDVNYQTGTAQQPEDERISLRPRIVLDDRVIFDLDFGSFEILDDGRMVRDALENAVQITSMKIRYAGDPLTGPASANYEAEGLTFALKVATVLDIDLDISFPGVIRFGGAAASEMSMQPFTVYCSQLYQPMQCSAERPLDVLNENGEPILSEIVGDGCWGTVTMDPGDTEIYVNNSVFPQCYVTSRGVNDQILIGLDVN